MKESNYMLYDSIIKRVSKTIKQVINEEKYSFNTTDYTEDDGLDIQDVDNITYRYFPKTLKELEKLVQQRIDENPEKPYLLDICTSSVTSMSSLFSYKTNIKILDLSTWDTSNVKDMDYMFAYCYSLTELDLSNFDTSNVVNMHSMFFTCNHLEKLDLSSFDTSKVLNMDTMFCNCNRLKELDLSNFDTSCVLYIDEMFYNCFSLTSLDLSNFEIDDIPVPIYKIFNGCASLKNLYTSSTRLKQAYNLRKYRSLDENIQNFDVTEYGDDNCEIIDHQTIKNNSIIKVKSFEELKKAVEIKIDIFKELDTNILDLTDIEVSSIDTFSGDYRDKPLFYDLDTSGIEYIDITGWNTANAYSFEGLFEKCHDLKKVYGLETLNVTNIRHIGSMFSDCKSLTELDFRKWTIKK